MLFKCLSGIWIELKNETGKSLKFLRSYRHGEFILDEFNIFYNDNEIKRQMSAPRTPPKNVIDERRNRSIMDCARTLMMEKIFSQMYWREAISIIVYTLN